MRTLLVAAAAAGAAVLAVRRGWLVVTVAGDSMLPALRPGDVVLARRRRPGRERPGEVVVLAPPDGRGPPGRRPDADRRWLVKRVAAVAGEPIPWEPGSTVPPGTVLVLGDNGGHDSRTFGPLPTGRVLGVVLRRIGGNAVP